MGLMQSLRDTKSKIVAKATGLEAVVEAAGSITGWVTPPVTRDMALASYNLPTNPTIVEVGCFMGRSTSLLAGARRSRGSGIVHAIDPFDCSGDGYSTPYYEKLLRESGASTLEEAFLNHMSRVGVTEYVRSYKGTSFDIVKDWDQPIDLLLLDGDQTPHIQRQSYENWIPFLKKGGTFLMNNVGERDFYEKDHDGSYLLSKQEILPPRYSDIRVVQYTLLATKSW